MRIAFDTILLARAEGVDGEERRTVAIRMLRSLREQEIILPARALGELFVVLTRKVGRPAAEARAAVLGWQDAYSVADTSPAALLEAMELATSHCFALRDAAILAVAAQTRCRLLLSEDMRDGFTWRGVTIRNPFGRRHLPASDRG